MIPPKFSVLIVQGDVPIAILLSDTGVALQLEAPMAASVSIAEGVVLGKLW